MASHVDTAAPQALAVQLQSESMLGQESSVKDQPVPPPTPVVVTAHPDVPIILVSKVGSSGAVPQVVAPPNSPTKTGAVDKTLDGTSAFQLTGVVPSLGP